MTTLLFLAANPSDTTRLRLGNEVRAIRERLDPGPHGDRFDLAEAWAVRVDDLQRHLIDHDPELVHFSGHGDEAGRILLEDERGRADAVPVDALSELFALLRGRIRCVVLNACFSHDQAAGIARHVDCVVGTTAAVNEAAAIAFSAAFYHALAAGKSVQEAFDLGKNEVKLRELASADAFVTRYREGVDAAAIRFAREAAAPPAPRAFFEGPGRTHAAAAAHFGGRDRELAALRELVRPERAASCVIVAGIGGVGKTSLVQQFVATDAPRLFPAGAVWLDGTALTSELPRAALRFGWQDARPPREDEALRALTLALHDKEALLVVDNVDPAKVDLALIPIPGGRCCTVLTTRSENLHADVGSPTPPLVLHPWDAATSRANLRDVAPALGAVPDGALDELTAFVGRLPLAIRLIARILLRPGQTPERVRARLEADPLRLLDSVAEGANRGVAATFNDSFAVLGDAHRRVLVALAACARSTRAAVVAAVAGIAEPEATDVLGELAERSLATMTEGADRPWSLHDVLRLFVGHQPGVEDAYAAHRAFAIAVADAHEAPSAAMEDEPEVLAAIDRLIKEKDGVGGARLLGKMTTYLRHRERHGDLVSACARLAPLLPESGELAAVELWSGESCRILGKVMRGVEHDERALSLCTRSNDRPGQVQALYELGRCHDILDDLPKAMGYYQRAYDLAGELGHLQAQAETIRRMGNCAWISGDHLMAVSHWERAVSLFFQIEDPGTRPESFFLTDVSRFNYMTRTIATTMVQGEGEVQERSMRLTVLVGELAETYEPSAAQANTFGFLAINYEVLGAVEKAIAYNERALDLATRLGLVEVQAKALVGLGSCWQTLGDLPRSLDYTLRARALADKLGWDELRADVLDNLGSHAQATGDLVEAANRYQQAIALLRGIGKRDEHADVRRLLALVAELERVTAAPG